MTDAKPRILVVDDEPANIRVLGQILKNEAEILVATGGEAALAQAREHRPDLILLDAMMPGMDGFAVCERLKADPVTLNVAVIFVTGNDSPEYETRALAAGAVDFITKPANPVVVRARVQTHVTLKRQTDLLRRLSNIDGLTGIANRRSFEEVLEREWRRAMRYANPLSVLLADVDFFKNYNDRHGHLKGDECLRQVARAVEGCCGRPADLAARFGGEEFVAILPQTDLDGALAIGEEMRRAVAGLAIPHGKSGVAAVVTLSLGVATAIPVPGRAAFAVVEVADGELYGAKKDGRDRVRGRVVRWDEDGEQGDE